MFVDALVLFSLVIPYFFFFPQFSQFLLLPIFLTFDWIFHIPGSFLHLPLFVWRDPQLPVPPPLLLGGDLLSEIVCEVFISDYS